MLKGLGDMAKIMKQAQEMQTKMAEATERMQTIEAEGSAGAGMVRAVATAQGELRSLSVDPALLGGGEEKEVLEDLIVAAVNDASKQGARSRAGRNGQDHRGPEPATRDEAALRLTGGQGGWGTGWQAFSGRRHAPPRRPGDPTAPASNRWRHGRHGRGPDHR